MQVPACEDLIALVSHCIKSPASPKQIPESTAEPLEGTKCCVNVSLLFLLKPSFTHTPETLTRKYALFCLQYLIVIYL